LFNFILGSGEDAQGIEFESSMVGATAGLTIARLGIQFSFNSEVKINSKIHNNLFSNYFLIGPTAQLFVRSISFTHFGLQKPARELRPAQLMFVW
jgi:hypothetical protein